MTEFSFDVKSNQSWTVTAGTGVTLDKTSGSNDGTVKMTFAANSASEAVKYTATVAASGFDPITVTVTQAGVSSGEEVVDTYTMIDKVANLAAGTYYMAGYLTSYETNGTVYDWSSYPYHVCNGVSTDLYTSTYSFADGVLTKNPDDSFEATDVVLEAVEGKTATFYVKIKDGYLYSSEYNNRKLGTSEEKVEWVATDNEKGGITLTTTMSAGTISVGTAGAASKLIRSYKNESTLKYGLVFFKKN